MQGRTFLYLFCVSIETNELEKIINSSFTSGAGKIIYQYYFSTSLEAQIVRILKHFKKSVLI